MAEEELTKAHCNVCGLETRHHVIVVHKQPGSEVIRDHPDDPGFEIRWDNTYYFLECCGCEEISIKMTHWDSEDPMDVSVEYFPPRVSRRQPTWLDKLPADTVELMREIYGALHADHRRLALMGARTVIDDLLVRKVGDTGTFPEKLDDLEAKGFSSRVNRDVLEAALDAGHAAVHRGYQPSPEDLSRVMDIIENALQAEMLSEEAKKLKASTPARKSRKGE